MCAIERTGAGEVTRLRSSTKTSAEDVLALELRAAGYEFIREVEYAPPRKLRADFAVYSADARLCVLIEVQGGVFNGKAHGSATGILADIDRGNEAAIAGIHMLRFTTGQIDAGAAIPTIERYFAAIKERTHAAV